MDSPSPSLPSDLVSNQTKVKLRETRKETQYSNEAPMDTVYCIETILDIQNVQDELPGQCKVCLKLFKSLTNLEKHVINKHPSVLSTDIERNARNYLVKWQGYPLESATWEHESKIPLFIKSHFEDRTKLGGPIPKPTIKKTKKVGTGKYHLLSWDTEA